MAELGSELTAKEAARRCTVLLVISCFLLGGCREETKVQGGAVLFLGDSLTSGHGLPPEARLYPEILGDAWGRRVISFSRAGMLAGQALDEFGPEVEQIKRDEVGAVFLVLGANDQLGGRSSGELRVELGKIAHKFKKKGWPVFVVQSIVPLRSAGYREAYREVSEDMRTPASNDIVEAYLRKEGGTASDGIHPSELGHSMIADILRRNYDKIMTRDN